MYYTGRLRMCFTQVTLPIITFRSFHSVGNPLHSRQKATVNSFCCFELWQLSKEGLVKESQGIFDADEYDRQVKYGVDD